MSLIIKWAHLTTSVSVQQFLFYKWLFSSTQIGTQILPITTLHEVSKHVKSLNNHHNKKLLQARGYLEQSQLCEINQLKFNRVLGTISMLVLKKKFHGSGFHIRRKIIVHLLHSSATSCFWKIWFSSWKLQANHNQMIGNQHTISRDVYARVLSMFWFQ